MQTNHISREDVEKILAVKAVLEKRYYNRFTHQDLAQMVGTNERKLRRDFKMVNSITISAYHTELRIGKAKDLLENSDLSLKVISIQVGLDKSNLVKTFKKLTGVTPMQWRVNSRNGIFINSA